MAKSIMEGIKLQIYALSSLQLVGEASPPTRAAFMCFHLAAFASTLRPIPASRSILRKQRTFVKVLTVDVLGYKQLRRSGGLGIRRNRMSRSYVALRFIVVLLF